MLKRRQGFEFCDQPWLKGWLREAFMDCLSFVHRVYQPYYHLVPLIAECSGGGERQVLDLASGSGEQVAILIRAGKKQNVALPMFTLSDVYPCASVWSLLREEFGQDAVRYIDEPLSAIDIPRGMPRQWSIFTAFHHFPPDAAKRFLEEVIAKGDQLCIIENQKRRTSDMAMMVLGLPVHLVVPFFAKRFSWQKLLLTTLIPLVPFMVAFDGVMSTLRTYTKEEIIAMLPAGWDNDFVAEYREVWWRFSPLKATMFSLRRKSG